MELFFYCLKERVKAKKMIPVDKDIAKDAFGIIDKLL